MAYSRNSLNESIGNRDEAGEGGGEAKEGEDEEKKINEEEEEEGSRRIEIEDSITAGSMLISEVESCGGRVRDWSARAAAPFCSFSREPPIYMYVYIYVEQSNLATIVICQPAPTLLRLEARCATFAAKPSRP